MDVTDDLVRHVARLARLELGEDEVRALVPQLDEILAMVQAVQEVATDDDAATQPPIGIDALREDVPGPTLDRDQIVRNAPAHDGWFLTVPRFLGSDE